MSISNKDRINENNDRINNLIALVKQKALTSNPKFAATEDEMDAMINDKNVDKIVKYLGEGDKYEKNALYIIAEDDGAASGLCARRLNVTEGSLAITENGKFDVSNMESVEVNVAGSGGGGSLTATTEEELNALDTAENVGKIVSYNDGLYIITED